MPIGLEDDFKGLIDLVKMKAYFFHGSSGSVYQLRVIHWLDIHRVCFLPNIAFCSENIVTEEIPSDIEAEAQEKRRELIEVVSEVDDILAESFLSDEPISASELEVQVSSAHFGQIIT